MITQGVTQRQAPAHGSPVLLPGSALSASASRQLPLPAPPLLQRPSQAAARYLNKHRALTTSSPAVYLAAVPLCNHSAVQSVTLVKLAGILLSCHGMRAAFTFPAYSLLSQSCVAKQAVHGLKTISISDCICQGQHKSTNKGCNLGCKQKSRQPEHGSTSLAHVANPDDTAANDQWVGQQNLLSCSWPQHRFCSATSHASCTSILPFDFVGREGNSSQ